MYYQCTNLSQMELLETATQLINSSQIPEVYGLSDNFFLILLVGSLVVGYTCLTFYYKVYHNNNRWTELDYFEKTIISLVVGFLSIIVSSYFVIIYKLTSVNNEYSNILFKQLLYVSPFLYFSAFSYLSEISNYKELDFIKTYILRTVTLILTLNFVFILIVFYIVKAWSGILLMILFILILLLLYKKDYLLQQYANFKN